MHSNYKELRNLVYAVGNVAVVGLLKDAELFFLLIILLQNAHTTVEAQTQVRY